MYMINIVRQTMKDVFQANYEISKQIMKSVFDFRNRGDRDVFQNFGIGNHFSRENHGGEVDIFRSLVTIYARAWRLLGQIKVCSSTKRSLLIEQTRNI
jgi:hypothetical protein